MSVPSAYLSANLERCIDLMESDFSSSVMGLSDSIVSVPSGM